MSGSRRSLVPSSSNRVLDDAVRVLIEPGWSVPLGWEIARAQGRDVIAEAWRASTRDMVMRRLWDRLGRAPIGIACEECRGAMSSEDCRECARLIAAQLAPPRLEDLESVLARRASSTVRGG